MVTRIGSTHHMSPSLYCITRPAKMVNTRGVTKESDTRYRKKSKKGAAHAETLTPSATATTK
jgi:hypothetical protein